ncbi:uncharacterized protein CEXT_295871 [Caerostris extrusa]|uniref:Uncharacterized protein n=1 Tax=Caerostris extrusa TaxID=172846 RepID=A0AAV4U6F7_CAEEX|nr:uncharacterized protein CEXT_295871 [Caerostris extrusa]
MDQTQMDSCTAFREVNRFEDSDSILRGEFKNLRSLCGSKGINFSSTLPVKFWQMWFCHSQIDQFCTEKDNFHGRQNILFAGTCQSKIAYLVFIFEV